MELKLENSFNSYMKNVEVILQDKKNLMIYEDFEDELSSSVYRFLYSNPKDLLEFICIDFYRNPGENIPYAVIKLITSCNINTNIQTDYGTIKWENVKVRDIDKIKISYILNLNGFKNIENAIKYFEENIIID